MSTDLRVLGIAGSLRQKSFNRALLRAAIELQPAGMIIETTEIRDLPLYDEDVRAAGLPPSVQELRERVKAADGILLVTPEYNFSVPGVLKNAIDWVSRPPSQPFSDKPLAIMGASGGASGTMRAQYHLRQIAVFLDMHLLNKPEVFVRNSASMFDADLRLQDEATRKHVADMLVAFAAWIRRLRTETRPSK